MLPTTVQHSFDTVDADEYYLEEQLTAIREMIANEDASAEFRVAVEADDTDNEEAEWLVQLLSNAKLPALEIVKLLLHIRAEEYGDTQQVMAVVYAQMNKGRVTAERIIELVDEQEYFVDYSSDPDQAYKDFGRSYYDNDQSDIHLDGNEDYFDWDAYGRDIAEGTIQYADGDWYVWKEWA